MFKVLLGFAAGYWVASRRDAGQSIVPADVQAIATKYANQTGLPLVATDAGLTAGNPGTQATSIKGKVQVGKYTVCIDSFNKLVDCDTGLPVEVG